MKIIEEMLGGLLMNFKGEVIGININYDCSIWNLELNILLNSISVFVSVILIGKIIDL